MKSYLSLSLASQIAIFIRFGVNIAASELELRKAAMFGCSMKVHELSHN